MIEVTEQVIAVRRQVGRRTLEAGEAHSVLISQDYDAPAEDVWDACTSPQRIPRWFLPVSGELKLGGRYQLEGNAGGIIERCDPPHSFAATWEFGGQVSWIEVRVTAGADGRTRLEIEHLAPVDAAGWAEFGPGAVGVGWDMALVGLASHLSSAGEMDPQRGVAWAASADGRRFITLSSARWGEASVASGTDAEAARAAAQRTTAFYTGGEAPRDAAP